jgi:hypothetical protein
MLNHRWIAGTSPAMTAELKSDDAGIACSNVTLEGTPARHFHHFFEKINYIFNSLTCHKSVAELQ